MALHFLPVLCESFCVSEDMLDVGWSSIIQVGMTQGNSVLLHVFHLLAV